MEKPYIFVHHKKMISSTDLLPTLFMILISHSPMPASCQSLYESLCRQTGQDAGLCLQLLKSDPQIPSARNYPDLSKFILKLAIEKGIQGQKYFLSFMKTNPSQAIHECATIDYVGTISFFKSAIREFAEDPQSAGYDAHVAGDGPANCAIAIKAARINNPDIFNTNKMMSLFSEVSYLATNHLA